MAKKTQKKNPAAVALGRKRWEGVSTAQRSAIARAAIEARWRKADTSK